MSLSNNLRAARTRMGISQELVADRLNVSRQAVTKWEAGKSKPSAQNLQALAELYEMSAEELLSQEQPKGPNLILRTNSTRIAIAAQAVFGHLCAHEAYQFRHYNDTDRGLYLGMFIFAFVLLMLASIWMASNHRYEPDKDRRRKNTKIELVYCLIQAFICVCIINYGMGWLGPILVIVVYAIYILYINPKFMNRKLTK
ncbi:MAG: helix-turn-helix transcriptional regulator [Oscillospiraceae bacterium]|nr:helix-turn-helix transcriptional regulator [Oscillospiraceae bacterium]